MIIKILFFARLKEIFERPGYLLEVSEEISVGEAVERLERELGSRVFGEMPLLFAVNQNFETVEKKLADQDELAIMTPLSGG